MPTTCRCSLTVDYPSAFVQLDGAYGNLTQPLCNVCARQVTAWLAGYAFEPSAHMTDWLDDIDDLTAELLTPDRREDAA